ncbi:hypothetical protein L2719_11970 [Shewanella schlegeliana]|uniref:Uncharacterized protein n=1 Tax=Shewanella schlegeliana TaxID=190308 RepID=A0ABS1STF0_9GAMM|nr:hypothetical protein [Shewanella schlegeliana]MBL4911783.1 hypothetical protein [Shewanella schlegeliana]MCL1110264.1 hypothetical protein [Shewanella schlegeliana]
MQSDCASLLAMPMMLIANIWEAIFEYVIYRTPKSANRQVNTENKA